MGQRKSKTKDPSAWIDRMKGIPCIILGNAPSLHNVDLSLLDGHFTIGINRIFYAYDPTILVWQDLALWTLEKKKVLKSKSIKYCREGSTTNNDFYTFKLEGRDPKLLGRTDTLYGRGSSGPITYQFAYALGCDPIVLVGMDCCHGKVDGKKVSDFYGNNPMHRPHTIPSCVKGLKFIRNSFAGRRVINSSDNKVFPKVELKDAISEFGEKRYTREELEKILLG